MSDTQRVYGDDEEINAAIAEAQQRLSEFRRVLDDDARRIIPIYWPALAKIQVESPITGAIEHLWLEGVYFEGKEVCGSVLTPPDAIPEVEKSEEIRVPASRITDWLYYEGDTMHGGFVEKILMARSDEEE